MNALVYATSATGFQSAELSTANISKVYKQCESTRNGLTLTQSGFLIAQQGKTLIHQYGRKEAPLKKLPVTEKLTAIEASPNGKWLAAGTVSGRLLVWSLETGSLLFAQEAHFQQVSSLKFTDDSAALITGSADARVLVWPVLELISSKGRSVDAQYTLTSHSLGVTDLFVGKGIFREARLYTASDDSTICVYDVGTGRLLYTLILGVKISTLVVDPVERAIYAGTATGIRVINLYNISSATKRLEALGSSGDLINIENAPLLPTTAAVTALALGPDTTILAVGDVNGDVSAWDIGSKQLLRKFRPLKGAITNLVVTTVPDDVNEEVPALQRVIEENIPDYIIPVAASSKPEVVVTDDDILGAFNGDAGVTVNVAAESQENGNEELEQIKEQYANLKKMYDDLWARHVKSK